MLAWNLVPADNDDCIECKRGCASSHNCCQEVGREGKNAAMEERGESNLTARQTGFKRWGLGSRDNLYAKSG